MASKELDDLIEIIIELLRTNQGVRKAITPATQICYQLGICDDDLDEVMLEAIRRVGRRPLMVDEPGSTDVVFNPELTVEGLAGFILTRCPRTELRHATLGAPAATDLQIFSKQRRPHPKYATASTRLRSYLVQVIATAAFAAIFVLATDAADYRGMLNVLGMFLPPVAIGLLLNRSWGRRSLMVIVLCSLSLLVSIIVGVNFTRYG